VKLGWTLVGGPPARRDGALAALELIADSYLSVSTPVQVAAPVLLARGAAVRGRIQERIRRNLARARTVVAAYPSCEVLRVEGGWTAVVRLPATRDEETVALELLQRHRVLVHPGYYYDLPRGTYVVVSLLAREEIFAAGFERLVAVADS
jgi:aspartate/methionine/tyrosine aminotransferase